MREKMTLGGDEPTGVFFVSFFFLIWLDKTILLYLPTERGFKKLKEPRVLDIIKVNCLVKR